MKSKTKIVCMVGFLLFANVLLIENASALESWQRWAIFDHLLSKSDDYDVIWEGPVADGTAIVALRGGSSDSALSNLNINSGNFDVLSYQKNDVRDYSSIGYGYPRYNYNSPWYQRYWSYPSYNYRTGSGFSDGRYFSDNSESLFIDNRLSNSIPKTNVHIFGEDSKNEIVHPRWDEEKGYFNWRY